MSDIDSFREELQSLISKFEKDKHYYLSKGYPAILHINLWEFYIFKNLTPTIRKNEKGDFEIISSIRSY